MNKRRDPQVNKGNAMALDRETAHTIGALAVAIINAMDDENYNAAVETLRRWAGDESRSDMQRNLFGSLVHVLSTPVAQLLEEEKEREKRERKFTVIRGGNTAA
jgi:hypothetical protein